VSLPTWADNVGYEEGDTRVTEKMITGYPRYVSRLDIQGHRSEVDLVT
jgi:cystathionine gamma-synthase